MEQTKESALKKFFGYLRSGIKRFFVTDFQFPLSFAIPCLILLLAYFIFGVYPFGKESVLSLDLNGQYVYYYDYMYDVFAGKESIFYSWSRNLSGEFMGIIGYYLGSPFNFLVWAFPRAMITEG
ncbi:MAG: YfhO family protein, partial [Ruminiclostridium sp.]|nr:YfhO family protein [Ruminiclostridium sp.]